MNKLLINRTFTIQGRGLYVKSEILNKYQSIISVIYIDTTSSAGDWTGLLIQKLYGKYYAIPFSQNNNYPHESFDICTFKTYCEVDYTQIKDENFLNFLWNYLVY